MKCILDLMCLFFGRVIPPTWWCFPPKGGKDALAVSCGIEGGGFFVASLCGKLGDCEG